MSSETKYKLEYVWLDGYLPEPNLRSKTKVVANKPSSPADCPLWAFDGSSTQQAEGHNSDCLLKPVAVYPDSTRKNGFLVMNEVLLTDGTPHPSNFRAPQPMRLHPTEPFFCYAPQQGGDMEIKPGDTYISRYRFVVHDGPPDRADLERLWNDYAHPPVVRVTVE